MVAWLTAEEQRAWRAYIEMTRLLFERLDRELQRDAGLPHAYYEILVALSEAPERTLRMSQLADLTQSSRSRLSHAVARLEESGWVRRVPCPTDRRGAFAILTDEGYEALAEAAPGHVEGVRRHVFDKLTPEQVEDLRRIAETVSAGLKESGPPPRSAAPAAAGEGRRPVLRAAASAGGGQPAPSRPEPEGAWARG
jgi:DNA-binding MarR family transcriptional regulator